MSDEPRELPGPQDICLLDEQQAEDFFGPAWRLKSREQTVRFGDITAIASTFPRHWLEQAEAIQQVLLKEGRAPLFPNTLLYLCPAPGRHPIAQPRPSRPSRPSRPPLPPDDAQEHDLQVSLDDALLPVLLTTEEAAELDAFLQAGQERRPPRFFPLGLKRETAHGTPALVPPRSFRSWCTADVAPPAPATDQAADQQRQQPADAAPAHGLSHGEAATEIEAAAAAVAAGQPIEEWWRKAMRYLQEQVCTILAVPADYLTEDHRQALDDLFCHLRAHIEEHVRS